MTDAITLHIIGTPAPQGSKNGYVRRGRVTLVESSKACKPWRESVHWQAREQYHGPLLDAALSVEIRFVVDRPQRLRKRLDVPSEVQPDVDKLSRATLDALTGVVWVDDARVSDLHAVKRHANPGEPTGCTITVREAV